MIGGGDAGLCAQLGASGFQVRRATDPASAARALGEVDLVVLTSRWPHAEDLASACATRGGPPVVWSREGRAARAPEGPALIGDAPCFQETLDRVAWAAPSEAPVLIEGESGTGKECLAALLHRLGQRGGPLVKLNCATLTCDELSEALAALEESRPSRGTLLLDALGELSPAVQAKLLEVLAAGRLGEASASGACPLDLRLVATASVKLRHDVAEGRFRRDLYFRLAVLPISVPPLRERKQDLGPLVEHFLARYSSSSKTFSPAALERLAAHAWPGNVRELANLVRRLALSCREARIGPALVSDELQRAAPPQAGSAVASGRISQPAGASMRSVERAAIASALEETGGNRAQAARLLGISVRTLYNRLKRYQREGRPLLESR